MSGDIILDKFGLELTQVDDHVFEVLDAASDLALSLQTEEIGWEHLLCAFLTVSGDELASRFVAAEIRQRSPRIRLNGTIGLGDVHVAPLVKDDLLEISRVIGRVTTPALRACLIRRTSLAMFTNADRAAHEPRQPPDMSAEGQRIVSLAIAIAVKRGDQFIGVGHFEEALNRVKAAPA